jgi:hypothetical protein
MNKRSDFNEVKIISQGFISSREIKYQGDKIYMGILIVGVKLER